MDEPGARMDLQRAWTPAYAAPMTQPSRALYLPPGVVPVTPPIAPSGPGGIPFDRTFFEKILPGAIAAFCQQVDCDVPLVELLTIDGTSHYVKGISGVSDSWVALHTIQQDHDHPIQVFIPYQTIFRVEVHPAESEPRHRLGFVLGDAPAQKTPPVIVAPAVSTPDEEAAEQAGGDQPESAAEKTAPAKARRRSPRSS